MSEWLTETLMRFKLGVVTGDDGMTSDDVMYEYRCDYEYMNIVTKSIK